MSATTVAKAAPITSSFPRTLPQVNLLPPEVSAGRQFGRVKSWLGLAALVTVLIVGMGVVVTSFSAHRAENELAAVQELNQNLQTQQKQYAEVPSVLNQIDAVKAARTAGMATETLWRPYLQAIAATAPAGVSIDAFQVAGATPMTPFAASTGTNPLASPDAVTTITFAARATGLPDTAAWITALATIPGVVSPPWIDSASAVDDSGTAYFSLSGTVQLTPESYALRFAADKEN